MLFRRGELKPLACERRRPLGVCLEGLDLELVRRMGELIVFCVLLTLFVGRFYAERSEVVSAVIDSNLQWPVCPSEKSRCK